MILNESEFLGTDPKGTGTITASDRNLPTTKRFKYFGSMCQAKSELCYETASHINAMAVDNRHLLRLTVSFALPGWHGYQCWTITADNERHQLNQ